MLKTLAFTLALAAAAPALAAPDPGPDRDPQGRRPGDHAVQRPGPEGLEPWLGYADPALTYKRPPSPRSAPAPKSAEIFKVVVEDGRPAIYVNGKTWGSLVHKGDFRDYHLRLQYKWGKGRWAPRETQAPNNGLLYHSHGAPGAVWGTWSQAVEFEIMTGSIGMVVPVGEAISATTSAVDDPALIDPKLRFAPVRPRPDGQGRHGQLERRGLQRRREAGRRVEHPGPLRAQGRPRPSTSSMACR
jgi:hypothetical protein